MLSIESLFVLLMINFLYMEISLLYLEISHSRLMVYIKIGFYQQPMWLKLSKKLFLVCSKHVVYCSIPFPLFLTLENGQTSASLVLLCSKNVVYCSIPFPLLLTLRNGHTTASLVPRVLLPPAKFVRGF
jgi:hypothetical protein